MPTVLAEPTQPETTCEPASVAATAAVRVQPGRSNRRRLLFSYGFLGLAISCIGGGILAAWLVDDPIPIGLGLLLAGCAAVSGVVASAPLLVRATTFAEFWPAALAAAGNLLMTFVGVGSAIMMFVGLASFSRGRQIRKSGRVLLPPVEPTSHWCDLPTAASITVPDSERIALAAQWRENGRTEHASVAAFARLTLDLIAVGAPASLIAASNQDSLDEIRHTELCFSLARKLDGEELGPGPFPAPSRVRALPQVRKLALARLAVDSLIDGALHEGLSARVVAKLAKRCEEPTIADVLREIAADEGRHAAHGWQVVQWCLAEDPMAVAMALKGALLLVPDSIRSSMSPAAECGAWERFGIPGRALEQTAYTAMRADIMARVAAIHDSLTPGEVAA